jgi:hypothetical protein
MEKPVGDSAVECFTIPIRVCPFQMPPQNGACHRPQRIPKSKPFCRRLLFQYFGHGVIHNFDLFAVKSQFLGHSAYPIDAIIGKPYLI